MQLTTFCVDSLQQQKQYIFIESQPVNAIAMLS